jgi:hypothetical protein
MKESEFLGIVFGHDFKLMVPKKPTVHVVSALNTGGIEQAHEKEYSLSFNNITRRVLFENQFDWSIADMVQHEDKIVVLNQRSAN